MRFFWQKKQKTSNVGKIKKYDEEKVFFFRGQNVFMFKNASLRNWEGAEYASGLVDVSNE